MVFVSIYPFASKKLLLLVVAFLCLSSAICFADSLFLMRHFALEQHRIRIHAISPQSNPNQSTRSASSFFGADSVGSGRHCDTILSAQARPTFVGLNPVTESAARFSAPVFRLGGMANPAFEMLLHDPWPAKDCSPNTVHLALN